MGGAARDGRRGPLLPCCSHTRLSLVGVWFLAGRALVPIRRAFGRQQEFVADASHELRTPLTVLRAAVDLLDQHRSEPLEANGELLADVRGEIARLERPAGDLLTLARSDVGELGLENGEVDLAAFSADVARRVLPLAQARQVDLLARSDRSVVVEAHGGHITLSSKLGVGTSVTIRLPRSEYAGSLTGRLGHLAARIAERPLPD